MDHVRGLFDDMRQLDRLLFSPNPQARLRGWLLGVLIMLGSATVTVIVAALT